MTVSSVLGRITQIQTQIQQLRGGPVTSGTGFSTQLDSALGGSGTVPGGSTARAATSPPTATTAALPVSPTATTPQRAVIDDAERYLGIPYRWGGTDPSTGLDCSGFVQRVYADLGYQLPRVSGDQARAGTEIATLDQAQPGDLLAFGDPVHHVALYAGGGQMIQAPRTGDVVKISSVADFGEPVTAIRRILPGATSSSAFASSAQDALAASRAAYDSQSLLGALR